MRDDCQRKRVCTIIRYRVHIQPFLTKSLYNRTHALWWQFHHMTSSLHLFTTMSLTPAHLSSTCCRMSCSTLTHWIWVQISSRSMRKSKRLSEGSCLQRSAQNSTNRKKIAISNCPILVSIEPVRRLARSYRTLQEAPNSPFKGHFNSAACAPTCVPLTCAQIR